MDRASNLAMANVFAGVTCMYFITFDGVSSVVLVSLALTRLPIQRAFAVIAEIH